MSLPEPLSVDVVIFGGGVAGLWLLDELLRQGYSALLLEAKALGGGQSIASQGIIHGGLKYMFDGRLNPAASTIAEMPVIWRECLAGRRQPDLSGTIVRSSGCHIWGTGSLKSRILLKGSALALRTVPVPVEKRDWPTPLANVSGQVLRVPEQVIDPASMAACFVQRNPARFVHIDPARAPEFVGGKGGMGERGNGGLASNAEPVSISGVRVRPYGRGEDLEIRCRCVVLCAGEGNEALRQAAGLPAGKMQRRPLHMVLVRGTLPEFWGHCIGGLKPRITITSAPFADGRNGEAESRREEARADSPACVWQIGGQIAEEGVAMDPPQLIEHAQRELRACLPGLDLRGAQLATYRIDRAEAAVGGHRPDDVQLLIEGNIFTAWPTKLALAPRLAQRVVEELAKRRSGEPANRRPDALAHSLPVPPLAPPPWEVVESWFTVA